MKIEIDLDDIIGDESGVETLQDSVRRQVVEAITQTIQSGIAKKIDREVSCVIDQEIKSAIQSKMPLIVDELLEAKYVQVDQWGSSTKQQTSVREQLVSNLKAEMVYKKPSSYDKPNTFTAAIDSLVSAKMKEFQSEFNKIVDAQFCKEAFDYAGNKLRERMQIKA
jgi:hypothetical protein